MLRWRDSGLSYTDWLKQQREKREANKAKRQSITELVKRSPITVVVEPLRAAAMERAEKFARETVADAKAKLKEAGNDLQIVAPYPKGTDPYFMVKTIDYYFYRKITKRRDSVGRGMHDPEFADIDHNGVAKYIKEAREDAS